MKQKLTVLLLLISLCVGFSVPAAAQGTGEVSTGDNALPTTPVSSVQTASSGSFYGFTDIRADWYADAVKWAVENEVTNGTSKTTFSPDDTCNRAHILTFLWRAAGRPEPSVSNPFQDVKSSDYYYQAALWAYENKMVEGPYFKGDMPCTRAFAVTYIWQSVGSPSAWGRTFDDVPANMSYATAVSWAVKYEITNGTSSNTFSPSTPCTRGQIVTFLYRAFKLQGLSIVQNTTPLTVTPVLPSKTIDDAVYLELSSHTSVTTFWGQTYEMDCNIPQFLFDTEDAKSANQEIMDLGLKTFNFQKSLYSPVSADGYMSFDYDAWLNEDIVVVKLTIQYYEGADIYLYTFDARTGNRITNDEVIDRLGLVGSAESYIVSTIKSYFIEYSSPYALGENISNRISMTLRADNLSRCLIFPDKDGTPMLFCYIYELIYANSYTWDFLALEDSTAVLWKQAYSDLLDTYYFKYSESANPYSIYDIDNNGIPELFVRIGKIEAEYQFDVYTFSNGQASMVGTLPGSFSVLCGLNEKGAMLHMKAVQGGEWLTKITLVNGRLHEEQLFCGWMEKYHPFEALDSFSWIDRSGLHWRGNPSNNNQAIIDNLPN